MTLQEELQLYKSRIVEKQKEIKKLQRSVIRIQNRILWQEDKKRHTAKQKGS